MEESLTISKKLPAFTSMQYTALRELGIKHIQELAGKLWTDYNTHDPGITILEALSYVITDLGYRVNYEIKDILAQNLNSPSSPCSITSTSIINFLKSFSVTGQFGRI